MLGGRIGSSPRRKSVISFEHLGKPSVAPHSKIGGYPNWISQPAWPISNIVAKEMCFFAQIRLDDEIFPKRKTDFAFIFVGDDDDTLENTSVVFQSQTETFPYDQRRLPNDYKGSVLKSLDNHAVEEFSIKSSGTSMDTPRLYADDEEGAFWDAYWNATGEAQIGGLPFFENGQLDRARGILGDMSLWRLLLYVTCDCEFPLLLTSVAPVYFVFVNEECTRSKTVGFCGI